MVGPFWQRKKRKAVCLCAFQEYKPWKTVGSKRHCWKTSTRPLEQSIHRASWDNWDSLLSASSSMMQMVFTMFKFPSCGRLMVLRLPWSYVLILIPPCTLPPSEETQNGQNEGSDNEGGKEASFTKTAFTRRKKYCSVDFPCELGRRDNCTLGSGSAGGYLPRLCVLPRWSAAALRFLQGGARGGVKRQPLPKKGSISETLGSRNLNFNDIPLIAVWRIYEIWIRGKARACFNLAGSRGLSAVHSLVSPRLLFVRSLSDWGN